LDRTRAPAPVAAAWASADAVSHRHSAEILLKASAYQAGYHGYAAALHLDALDPEAPDGLVRSSVAAHREPDAVTELEAAVPAPPKAVSARGGVAKSQGARGS